MTTKNEREHLNNINRIAGALEKIATQLTKRSAEECENRAKIVSEMQLAEITRLKEMLNDSGIKLCEECGEEIALNDGLCDGCYDR